MIYDLLCDLSLKGEASSKDGKKANTRMSKPQLLEAMRSLGLEPDPMEIGNLFSSATVDPSDTVDLRDVLAILKSSSDRSRQAKTRRMSMSKVEWLLDREDGLSRKPSALSLK